MTTVGVLVEAFAVASITNGASVNQRIGEKINLHRWMLNLNIFGGTGAASSVALTYRVIIAYARSTCISTDFPQGVDEFWDYGEAREKGIYAMKDITGTLAPTTGRVTVTSSSPDTYAFVRWCAAHRTNSIRRMKFRLKGRERLYDDADGIIARGRLYVFAVSESDAAEVCRFSYRSRLYYTDA